MYEILTAVEGIVILITTLGCVPYGIWIILCVFAKRWKWVALQIGIPITVYACLACISAVCDPMINDEYLAGLYDSEVKLGPAIFEYHSGRSLNGDGYSFSVHELPAAVRQRFESADDRLLTGFPKHPSYRNGWKFHHWRETPHDDKQFENYLEFALSSSDALMDSRLYQHFNAIRTALARKGTYLAFFHNGQAGGIDDIDLFIVDLVEGRLYSINHNT